MKAALDSNILLYFARVLRVSGDVAKSRATDKIMAGLQANATIVIPLQVLGECYNVMQRNDYTRVEARVVVGDWADTYETAASDRNIFQAAVELATDHKLQFWDALILSTAAEAGCSLLLSEDMQPGFKWRRITVIDPFAAELDRRLKLVLEGDN